MTVSHRRLIELGPSEQAALVAGARDTQPVRGLTHNYYKYPARFSPSFVKAAIEVFTEPADLVLDNHVGGGTTLVEALALGRHAIGIDISSLAEFVSTAKTTVFSEDELKRLSAWMRRLPGAVHIRKPSVHLSEYAVLGYYKHLNHPSRWRLRKAIEQALASAVRLECPRLESFARCVVLRTAQWALDSRKTLPSIEGFREKLVEYAGEMLAGATQFSSEVGRHSHSPSAHVINRSAVGIDRDWKWPAAPRLVVTSPPYPGVHVLYHRWQVDGRKEAPLPFMIANKLDGSGSSYYTMGDRKYPMLRTYFDNIRASMASIAAIADGSTTVVQMVAFSDAAWQLPRYLETMDDAGLTEVFLPVLQGQADGRLWRTVPGRRWYSDQRGRTPGSQEVVLIHRLKGSLARGGLQSVKRLTVGQVLKTE